MIIKLILNNFFKKKMMVLSLFPVPADRIYGLNVDTGQEQISIPNLTLPLTVFNYTAIINSTVD